MSQPITIICAAANAPYTIPGSDFTHTCAECGRRVMLSPSGQDLLRKEPDARLVCPCSAKKTLKHAKDLRLTSGTLDAVLEELRTTIPNERRTRN